MNLLDLPEQSTTWSSSPAWKAFWTADKYLTCSPFHGKYSLQSNYFRFLQVKWQAVSADSFRMWRKRRYPWGGLHLSLERFPCWLQCGTGCLWLSDTDVLSHLRPEQELSTNPLLLALQSLRLQQHHGATWALAGIQLGSSAQHSLHFLHSTFSKKPASSKVPDQESRIQLDSVYNTFELSTNYQFTPTKIKRASPRFDWSQG